MKSEAHKKLYFSPSFLLLEGDHHNTHLPTASVRSLCIFLCSATSTDPAANPPRGDLYPIAVWQEQSDLEHTSVTNVTVRWIRTVSQDKISGKQAGEQWVMALCQFTC